MTVSVIIPWRGGDPDRERHKIFVEKSLRRMLPGAFFMDSDSDPSLSFNRGEARNRGAGTEDSLNSDVLVFVDADTIPEEQPLHEAIYNAQQDRKMHLPYTNYRCLTPSATKKFLRGHAPLELKSEMDTEWACSGVVVISPQSYWEAGGQPEFSGYGFEDTIFKIRTDAIHGRAVRHAGTVHHLWHPKTWSVEDKDYLFNKSISDKYVAAEGDKERIQKLIDTEEEERWERQE